MGGIKGRPGAGQGWRGEVTTPGYSPCLSQQPRAKAFSRPLDRLGQAGRVTGALDRNQIRSPPSSLAPPDGPQKKTECDRLTGRSHGTLPTFHRLIVMHKFLRTDALQCLTTGISSNGEVIKEGLESHSLRIRILVPPLWAIGLQANFNLSNPIFFLICNMIITIALTSDL